MIKNKIQKSHKHLCMNYLILLTNSPFHRIDWISAFSILAYATGEGVFKIQPLLFLKSLKLLWLEDFNQNLTSCKMHIMTLSFYNVLRYWVLSSYPENTRGQFFSPNFTSPRMFLPLTLFYFTKQNSCSVDIRLQALSFARNDINKNKTPGNVERVKEPPPRVP